MLFGVLLFDLGWTWSCFKFTHSQLSIMPGLVLWDWDCGPFSHIILGKIGGQGPVHFELVSRTDSAK